MPAALDKTTFGLELDKKLDALFVWAMESTSSSEANIALSDFSQVRKEIHRIATGEASAKTGAESQEKEPEPSEGGAQYINDNPTPWP